VSEDLVIGLLDDFRRRREAGERPDPLDYLDRAGPDRAVLAGALELLLADVPAPPPAPGELERLAAHPRFAPRGWPELLVQAREERRLLRRTAVARLTDLLGLAPSAAEPVGRRLHELEAGTLSPAGVSERVIGALDRLYDGIGEALRRTQHLTAPPPSPAPMAVFHRAADEPPPLELRAYAGAADEPSAEAAEVDRLFLGG
jgi:hypothetical protein